MALPQMKNPGPITEEEWAYFLQFLPSDYIRSIANGINNENRFFVDERFQKLLFNLFFDPQSRYVAQDQLLPKVFFRARVYNESDAQVRFDHPEKYNGFQGFDEKHSGAPCSDSARASRANPEGISYLYVATDEATAIKEVRAQPGDYVSVATVTLRDMIIVANLANGFSCIEAEVPERSRWINGFVLSLEGLFQSPAGRIGGYFLCQYISEYVKIWGLQGIEFRSSFSTESAGIREMNITIFDESHCKVTASKLYYVAGMQIEIIPPLSTEADEL